MFTIVRNTHRALTQTYIWLGWAAYCASLVISYVWDPGVTQRWAYFATAFVALNIPIAFLAIRERMTIHSDEERRRLEAGTTLYRGLTVVGLAVFCLAPPLMYLPYGWLVGRHGGAALEAASNVEELIRMADLGIPRAQHTLGVRYREGRGVFQDDTEALRLWRAAAEQGYDESQAQLCDVYAHGQGVPQDDRQAADWCARAAENGDAQASYHLGTLHARGLGVSQDRAEAARWYRIAAEHGVPEAQAALGLQQINGDHVPVDLVQAYQWLTLAARQTPFSVERTAITEVRNDVRGKLTPEQLAEATQRLLEWQPTRSSDD